MWRESWGYNRNYCRISHSKVAKETVIGSQKTAQRAMSKLLAKRFVVRALFEDGQQNVNSEGSLYRIITPQEIIKGETEEGISIDSLPIEGVVMINMPNIGMVKMTMDNMTNHKESNNNNEKQSMDNMGTGQNDHSQNDHSQNDHHTLVNMGMDNMTRLTRKEATMGNRGSGSQNDYGQNDQHLKDISKDSFKDSLSIDEVIFLFYNSIGQEKLSKAKRERAKNCFEELIQDGFTNDDIQFAVEWTIKNAKEKPYDFALIKDTIGQAIAAKKETEAEEQKNLKREQNRAKQLAEEKKLEEEREKIEAYKESLSPKQRSELREKALSEIKKLGTIREELIGQPLIEAKENEILKDELSADE